MTRKRHQTMRNDSVSRGINRSGGIATSIGIAMIAAHLTACSVSMSTSAPRPASGSAIPERGIRRTIPITNSIAQAYAAGTRDSSGRPGPKYWQLRVDYTINARLDPTTATVTGRENVVIYNTSPDPLRRITLRLDHNVFRADAMRAGTASINTEGIRIKSMTVAGRPVSLLNPPVRGQPIQGDTTGAYVIGTNETVATIRLKEPIAPGGSATLEAEWSTQIPERGGVRTGRWADSLFQVAQWYPRVTVYDDLRGWDTEPYLGPSEFYNNYGRFDVKIDVPGGWIVGSTGMLQNAAEVLSPTVRERLSHVLESDEERVILSENEFGRGKATADRDRLVWHFIADTVSDVAWAASNRYVWKATRANIAGRSPVPLYLLHTPGRASRFTRMLALTKHALEFYSKLWTPYAFPQLTAVDGPYQGMEYPMFIMSGEGAADHEAGHEWWPMMIGVNETWYGWMDEGFNEYMNILSDSDFVKRPPVFEGRGQSYGQISGNELEPPMMWPANYSGPQYGFQTYGKAPLMLSMLGGIVGDSAVQRAMSDYSKAWLFKHPSPWDYMFFMNRALNRDLGWFWYYWLFTTERVDGSLQSVATSGNNTVVTVHQAGEMPSPIVLDLKVAGGGNVSAAPIGGHSATVQMINDQTVRVTYPVDVWFPGSRTLRVELNLGGRSLEGVTLDPDGRFPDKKPADNRWSK
jgi:hypothetical protein